MSGEDRDGNVSCSFCGKTQRQVRKLIAGPSVYICDECIGLCKDIIAADEAEIDRMLAEKAERVAALACRLADACREAPAIPRPLADRASALARDIGAFVRR